MAEAADRNDHIAQGKVKYQKFKHFYRILIFWCFVIGFVIFCGCGIGKFVVGTARLNLLSTLVAGGDAVNSDKVAWIEAKRRDSESLTKFTLSKTVVVSVPRFAVGTKTQWTRCVGVAFGSIVEVNLLGSADTGDDASKVLNAIRAPGIERISLGNISVTEAQLRELMASRSIRQLKVYHGEMPLHVLMENGVTSPLESLEVIECGTVLINRSPTASLPLGLRRLSLSGNIVAGDSEFAGMISKLKSLETIYLSGRGFRRGVLEQLRHLPNLRNVTLSGCSFTPEDLSLLADCRSVEELNIQGEEMTFEVAARLIKIPSLRRLGLPIRALTKDEVLELSKLNMAAEVSRLGWPIASRNGSSD